eukprot:349770_1
MTEYVLLEERNIKTNDTDNKPATPKDNINTNTNIISNLSNSSSFTKFQILAMIILLIFNIIDWINKSRVILQYLDTSDCAQADKTTEMFPFGIVILLVTVAGMILCCGDFYLFCKCMLFDGELYIVTRVKMEIAIVIIQCFFGSITCYVSAFYIDFMTKTVKASIIYSCVLSIMYAVLICLETNSVISDAKIIKAFRTDGSYKDVTAKWRSYMIIICSVLLLSFLSVPTSELDLTDSLTVTIDGDVNDDFDGYAFKFIYYDEDITVEIECDDNWDSTAIRCNTKWKVLDELIIETNQALFDYDVTRCTDINVNINSCNSTVCVFSDEKSGTYEICYDFCLWNE